MLTHYQECMLHSVGDPECPPNAGFRQALREWQDRCQNVMVYEYYHKANWWGGLWPVWENILQDIPLFHEMGITGFNTQYSAANSLARGLSYWLAARLTRDPGAAGQELIEEWISGVYGQAADPMHEAYHRLAESFYGSEKHMPGGARRIASVFDAELCATLKDLCAAASGRAGGDEEKWAVAAFTRAVQHTDRLRRYSEGLYRAAERDEELPAELKELFNEVTRPLKQNPEAYRGLIDLETQFAEGFYLNGEHRALEGERIIDLGALGER
jgi:hypothetical protein